MRPPEFWQTDGVLAQALEPLGRIYGAVTGWRLAHAKPVTVDAPVICIGNLTVGGTGKTPIARDIAERLRRRGHTPAVVLRGYGGQAAGPLKVDTITHTAGDVGDEALLHARDGSTWVARKRAAGAAAAIENGADVIVLDDGLQHPGLHKDLSLVVIDGRSGFGNHRIVPSGPLRERVGAGLRRADAVVLMGEDRTGLKNSLPTHLPVLQAHLKPAAHGSYLSGRRVVAFAGLGEPGKFFDTLHRLGARVLAAHPFEDHHLFQPSDIQTILDEAYGLDALPVTTEKDAMRLTPDQRQQVDVLAVTVAWENETEVETLLDRLTTR